MPATPYYRGYFLYNKKGCMVHPHPQSKVVFVSVYMYVLSFEFAIKIRE